MGNSKEFKKYWPADVHCIGKDIIKFHAVYWPAMLLSAGLELPKTIFVHGFITANGQKMSKSLGNVIDPIKLAEKYLPAGRQAAQDAVRYYLLREIPPIEDGDFTYEKFEQRYNSDLADGIGNLVSRVVALAAKSNPKFQITKPKKILNPKLKKEIKSTHAAVDKLLGGFRFNEALKAIWDLISWCDKCINEEKPWEGKKNAKVVISDLICAINEIAELIDPFLPETSEKIKNIIKTKKSAVLFPRLNAH